jgi:SSS family solute:Na+ symporter
MECMEESMQATAELAELIGWSMGAYLIVLVGISFYASKRIQGSEDFIVAGRRLGLALATATLLATWFGAGTLMAAADEICAVGLQGAALDPFGAGVCLLIFGTFFAGPLWREKLLTLPEVFGRRFGTKARKLGAILMIPPYLGWIAAQFMALAGIITLFFDLPFGWTLAVVAMVGTGYTMLGGMWAVSLTDAFQLGLVILGLIVLTFEALAQVGGLPAMWASLPAEHRVFIPMESMGALMGFIGVVAAGALGNIPSQDVSQRVFSSRSETVAKRACWLAGGAYLLLGLSPVILGLVGRVMEVSQEQATVVQVASVSLNPVLAVLLVVTLMSVILSTIDGALLAPASVLVNDLLTKEDETSRLGKFRLGVGIMGAVSLGLALAGENAYAMLEASYELGMVSLLAPLTYALYAKKKDGNAALASMLVGTFLWLGHYLTGKEYFLGFEGWPLGLCAMILSFLAYPAVARRQGDGNTLAT